LARYNSNGSLDDGTVADSTPGDVFGSGGKVTTDFAGSYDGIWSSGTIALQADGKIVVAGYSNQGATRNDFALARYNTDGSLDDGTAGDTTPGDVFGSGGKVITDIGGSWDNAYDIAVQADGKLVVAGESHQGDGGYDFALVRYSSDGAVDSTFGVGGTVTTDLTGRGDGIVGVIIQPDGKIVAAGWAGHEVGLARYIGASNSAPTTPVDTDPGANEVNEGAGGPVGITVSSTDAESGVTYSLSDDANGRFQVDADTGVVTVADPSLLNFEDDASHTVTVVADDGSGPPNATSSQTFTITVNNVAPTQPVDDDPTESEVEENAANGTEVGIDVSSTDPNGAAAGGNVTFSLSDNAGGRFQIDAATGVVTVADGSLLDFETATSHDITVVADDGSGAANATSSRDFTVNLTDVRRTISGMVFVDVNGDEAPQANEPGIDGVTVTLTGGVEGSQVDTTSMGGVYAFEVGDEFGTYQIVETHPTGVDDGAEILGNLDGTANPSGANDVMELTLDGVTDANDYYFAELGRQVTSGDTATIGFWQNKHGQKLITDHGDGLAAWLTDNFPNVFGETFSDGSGGDDGGEVAQFFKTEFFKKKLKGTPKVDAQFMAVAFASYFTSSHLSGGTAAESYGFNVTDTGIGTKLVNVGAAGAAFGVVDNTDMTVMQLLLATNSLTDIDGTDNNDDDGYSHVYDQDGDGTLSEAEKALRAMADEIYTGLNEGGHI
jgi:uncharacterized delta-60 repeat protein